MLVLHHDDIIMQEAVTLAPAINDKSRKIAQAREENSMERLTAPKRTFAHPVVKKPPKVSQADFNKRQRERYVQYCHTRNERKGCRLPVILVSKGACCRAQTVRKGGLGI